MPKAPVKSKNPVGRPRKDGLPAGYYKHLKTAQEQAPAPNKHAPGATAQVEKRPRGRPCKNVTVLSPRRVRQASVSAPVAGRSPRSAPKALPVPSRSLLSSIQAPSQVGFSVGRGPKAGTFTYPSPNGFYNTHITIFSDTTTEFDDETDIDTEKGDENTEDTLISVVRPDEKEKMFPLAEAEDDPPTKEELAAQTKEERREASRRRQKRMCESHNCYNQDCWLNHVRHANMALHFQDLDQRISESDKITNQVHELLEEEARTSTPIHDAIAVEGGARSPSVMETEPDHDSQFETLFSEIMQARERDERYQPPEGIVSRIPIGSFS